MSLATESFIEDVTSFCVWAESDTHALIEARQHLIALMTSIPHLQSYRFSGISEVEYPRRGHDGWKQDHKRFGDLPFQYYRVVFSPLDTESSDEPVMGDLCDDLAGIYGDLWEGLQAHKAGDNVEALSLWIDSYFTHWGQHASEALRAIDCFYRENPNSSEQVAAPNP